MQALSTRPCENNSENSEYNSRCACLKIFQATYSVRGATQLLGGCSLETICVQVRAPEAPRDLLGGTVYFP